MKLLIAILALAIGLGIPAARIESQEYIAFQVSLIPGVGLPFGIGETGVAIGAIGNINGNVDVFQLGGVFNVSGDLRGLQTAGAFNVAGDVRGMQLGGVFNVASDVKGLQTAGVFNVARDVVGLQMGLVNIAREVKGFQIGLVNISRNGILDLTGTFETQTGYFFGTLRTGAPSFYTFYSVGAPEADWFTRPDGFVMSTGVATRIGDFRVLFLDVSAGVAQALGSDPARFFQGLTHSNGLTPADVLAPWPVFGANLGLDMGPIHIVGGVSIDFDMASSPNVPAGLKKGWSFSDAWFGQSFTAWTKWYLGIGL